MSTIKIEFWSEDKNEIAQLLSALAGVNENAKSVKNIEVVDAEEVKAPEKKAAATRPSRAKAKPEPEPEPEEEEDEDLLGEEAEDEDEQGITQDDVKAMLAKKVATNRDAIVKKLKSYGAEKISELESSSYKDFYDFMAKLK